MYLSHGLLVSVQFGLLGSIGPKPAHGRWKDGISIVPSALIAARNMLFRSGYVYGALNPFVNGCGGVVKPGRLPRRYSKAPMSNWPR